MTRMGKSQYYMLLLYLPWYSFISCNFNLCKQYSFIGKLSWIKAYLLSYETGFGATRVTYGRGSERLSQNVTIYPDTPKSVQADIAKENNGKSYFQADRLGSALFASN